MTYYDLVSWWHRSPLSEMVKRARAERLLRLAAPSLANRQRVRLLDLGCANGKDLLRFLNADERFELHGLDVEDWGMQGLNVTFHQVDAEETGLPDKHFDITVSMGVLEHIQPMEKLCRVAAEIERISKSYYILVPSIRTLIEPHTGSLLWQIRDHNSKQHYSHLNYLSDEAWLQFAGFSQARTMRSAYIPLLKQDLWIFKHADV